MVCPRTQKQVNLRKRYVVVLEKYIEDAGQDEKHVPDPLEAITRAPGFVKEDIRPNALKMIETPSKM